MSVDITYTVHGATKDNEKELASGWSDPGLSLQGIEESEELKLALKNKSFDLVISSDLRRAVQTAEIVFGAGHFTEDPRLREANYGDWNGKKHHFKDSMTKYVATPFPNGESYHSVEKRMREFCQDIKTMHDGRHIVIVAHQAPQLALEVILNGKTWAQAIKDDWRSHGKWQPGWSYTIP